MNSLIDNLNYKITNISIYQQSFRAYSFPSMLFWDQLMNHNWEDYTYRLLNNHITSKDNCIDIGCSFGPISFFMAKKGNKVYSCDPDPKMAEHFINNLDLNKDLANKITFSKLALYNKNEKRTLFARRKYGHSSSSLLKRVLDNSNSVEVDCYDFKTYVNKLNIRKCKFIKIDIEGGEYNLIPEMAKSLEVLDWPILSIALHNKYLVEEYFENLIKIKSFSQPILKIINKLKIKINFIKTIKSKHDKLVNSIKTYNYFYNEKGDRIDFQKITIQLNHIYCSMIPLNFN